MSWWTHLRDSAEKTVTGGLYDPAAIRKQQQMVNAQIKAYQDQTELAKQQLDEARTQEDAEKRKVNEKQIRSLRSTYRGQNASLLGVGDNDMTTNLGG